MTVFPVKHTAFSAGVVSPAFYGRDDLERYNKALSYARNFYFDYRGGFKNRPGTRLLGDRPNADLRFEPFVVGSSFDTFLLIFSHEEMRVMQAGKFIIGTAPNPLVVDTPWAREHLRELVFAQRGLRMRVTHKNYDPHDILLSSNGVDWTIEKVDLLQTSGRPANLTAEPSAAGDARYVIAVTAVDKDGRESLPSRPYLVTDSVNFTMTTAPGDPQGSVMYECSRVDGARFYRWYRSIVAEDQNITIAQSVGFIGESESPSFVDANIIPDFGVQPPIAVNPFSGGQVLQISVTAGGTGYDPNEAIVQKTAGPGTGLIAHPVIRGGEVIDVMVRNWGQDFDGTSVLEVLPNGGGGTGAEIEISDRSPSGERNPGLVTFFQQRCVFASTKRLPNGIWGSGITLYDNFSTRPQAADDESFEIYPDLPGNDAIKHIVPIQDSLLVFHSYGVERVHGAEGRAVTPNDHTADPQGSGGAGAATPVVVVRDVVYSSPRGDALYAMHYEQSGASFIPDSLSTFAEHYFLPYREPKRLAWQAEPDHILWVLMTDGRLLSLTYVPDHEIIAWAEHETAGKVLDICCVREKDRDVLYLFVERIVGAVKKYFIESMEDRRVLDMSSAWFVDCGLSLEPTPVETEAVLRVYPGVEGDRATFRINAEASVFNSSSVGRRIFALGGVFVITEFVAGDTVMGYVLDDMSVEMVDFSKAYISLASGSWGIITPTNVFTGLDHLEGEHVSILADSDVYLNERVVNGKVNLPGPYGRVVVGLGYTAVAKSLPIGAAVDEVAGRKKRIVKTHVRLNKSLGVEAGTPKQLWPMRDTLLQDQPNRPLRSEQVEVNLSGYRENDASITIRQKNPLPAEVLSFTMEVEV